MEGVASDKHSILLQTLVNYGRKKLYNIDTRAGRCRDHHTDDLKQKLKFSYNWVFSYDGSEWTDELSSRSFF